MSFRLSSTCHSRGCCQMLPDQIQNRADPVAKVIPHTVGRTGILMGRWHRVVTRQHLNSTAR